MYGICGFPLQRHFYYRGLKQSRLTSSKCSTLFENICYYHQTFWLQIFNKSCKNDEKPQLLISFIAYIQILCFTQISSLITNENQPRGTEEPPVVKKLYKPHKTNKYMQILDRMHWHKRHKKYFKCAYRLCLLSKLCYLICTQCLQVLFAPFVRVCIRSLHVFIGFCPFFDSWRIFGFPRNWRIFLSSFQNKQTEAAEFDKSIFCLFSE